MARTKKQAGDLIPEMRSIRGLIPYPHNPRSHPPEQIKLLADLIQKYGPDQAIVVDENDIILKGHGRLEAAKMAGLDQFPVVTRTGLSDADKIAIRIADNQVALLSGWDQSLLKGEITSLRSSGYDIELLGFGDVELISFETMPGLATDQQVSSVGNLADRFGIVPFSTLNAREGWWQDRKRAWLSIGIQSELGRGENLLKFSDTINEPDPKKRAANKVKKQKAGA